MQKLLSAQPVGLKEQRLQVTCSNCFSYVNSHNCLEPTYIAFLSVGRQQLLATTDLVPLLELAFPSFLLRLDGW